VGSVRARSPQCVRVDAMHGHAHACTHAACVWLNHKATHVLTQRLCQPHTISPHLRIVNKLVMPQLALEVCARLQGFEGW